MTLRRFSWRLGVLFALASCGDSGGDGPPAQPQYPCAVARALETHCFGCHGDPPALGVPFSLATWTETREETSLSRSGNAEPIWQTMAGVLEDGRMPLDPDTGVVAPLPMDDPDRLLLLDWLASGALPAEEGVDCRFDGGT